MKQALQSINRHFVLVTTLSFALTPVIGYAVAIFFDVVDTRVLQAETGRILFLFCTLLASWAYVFNRRFLLPVIQWKMEHPDNEKLPDDLHLRLRGFSSHYWGFLLLYVLTVPVLQHWLASIHNFTPVSQLLQFMLLQLIITILVGMPGYLDCLATLGKLSRYTGVAGVQINMRTKMLLVGGYIPLLTTSILLKYYWWRTGYLAMEVIMAWAMLGLTAFVITIISIRNLRQSLEPVYNVITGSGATPHSALSEQLKPASTDEVGILVQTLGKLFRHVQEQDEFVQAIVDNAAEGIIVVDNQGRIELCNPAAENLFGYGSSEIRHLSLKTVIPQLSLETLQNIDTGCEVELESTHRRGKRLVLSLRVSIINTNNDTYYSLLLADITQRKITESMLRTAEERYRNLVVTAHDLVWSLDEQGKWTYLNEASHTIYGYPTEAMLSRHFTDYSAEDYVDRDQAALERLLNGEELLGYETRHINSEGLVRYISFNARPQLDENGNVNYITGTARDITDQKAFEKKLTYQAQHDTLTGLYNRNYFQQEMERLLTRLNRSGAECALLYIDLDHFKYINDTLGHAAGDRLLIEVSHLLREKLREGDLLSRFGGDEFTILLYNTDPHSTETVAKNILQFFDSYRFFENQQNFNVSCSIGIARLDGYTASADEAMSHADLACNLAKSQGRNRFHIYNPEDRQLDGMAEDMGWASRVRDAYENNRFSLVYQPIISLDDGKTNDYEVLLRLALDNGDTILPGGFMPAAERFGLIHNVDRWAVSNAIHGLAKLHQQKKPVRFAVNLSGYSFEDSGLLDMIHHTIEETGLDPTYLTFEITESAAIANLSAAKTFISRLKDMGCEFALDDFGSGFCSFSYLKHLPVDKLKIDGSFVQNLANAKVDRAMVKSMNQIAHALGKQTIAEFVENKRTYELLKDYGVDYAQGNYLSEPLSNIHFDSSNILPFTSGRPGKLQ